MRNPREVDRYTSEDTARMQAMWTGIILAVVLLGPRICISPAKARI